MQSILALNLNPLVVVISDTDTPRLRYILHEIFVRRLGLDVRVTTSYHDTEQQGSLLINYTSKYIPGTIHIHPQGLLSEDDIKPQQIAVSKDPVWRFIFFANTDPVIPFDVFAASFFLLSRYEEYLPHEADEHGRFRAEDSVAYQHGFIQKPLVDIWCEELKQVLLNQNPALVFAETPFTFTSTIDVDFAYRYIGIGPWRNLMKLGKSLVSFNWKRVLEQCLVMLYASKDPYKTYDLIERCAEHNNLPVMYFFLMAYYGHNDKGIFPRSPAMKRLLNKLKKQYIIGLHPSYTSNKDHQLLGAEKKLLEQQLGHRVYHTRQHFLKMELPQTYMRLIEMEFTHDHSMAYPHYCGFRASTCKPFYFFNLHHHTATTFTIHAPTIMDVSLKNNMQLTPEQAMKCIETLMNEVKKVGGHFMSIWHNSNLTEDEEWSGWRDVYEKMHTLAASKISKQID